MVSQIVGQFLVVGFAGSVATLVVGAVHMGRTGDWRDFTILGAGGAIMCAGLIWALAGAVA